MFSIKSLANINRLKLPGFTLIDVMISMVISGMIVLLIAIFARDMIRYSYFIANHQQIRQESFALVNNLLATVIREAVAVNYDKTNESTLALYMDKLETKTLTISLQEDLDSDKRQLVIDKDSSFIYLNSSNTFVTDFKVEVPERPDAGTYEELQEARAYQPTVKIYLAARAQRPDGRIGDADENFLPWEDPRISYSGRYTLRNYSFSSLQH